MFVFIGWQSPSNAGSVPVYIYTLEAQPPHLVSQRWPFARRKKDVTRKESGKAQTPAGRFSNAGHAAKMFPSCFFF